MAKKRNKFAGDQGALYDDSKDATGVSQYLGLGRPIEFGDNVFRVAIIVTVLSVLGLSTWYTMHGVEAYQASMDALSAALGFFFAFTLAQELDPDRKLGGIVGGGLSLLGAMFFGPGNVLVLMWLIWIMRMFTRTSGDRHKMADNVIILGCALWLGRGDGFWLVPILTGIAYVVESQIRYGYVRSMYLAAIALFMVVFCDFRMENINVDFNYIIMFGLATVLFMPLMKMAYYTEFKADKTGNPIDPVRLQTAQGMFLFIAISLAVFMGNEMCQALIPAFGAAFGCGLYLIADLVANKGKKKYRRRK